MLHELTLSNFVISNLSPVSTLVFLGGFFSNHQNFSNHQALGTDLGPTGSYCPLPFDPDFGHL